MRVEFKTGSLLQKKKGGKKTEEFRREIGQTSQLIQIPSDSSRRFGRVRSRRTTGTTLRPSEIPPDRLRPKGRIGGHHTATAPESSSVAVSARGHQRR